MIFNHELHNLSDDEYALLCYIVTDNGKNLDRLEFITSISKKSIIIYLMSNKKSFTKDGWQIAESLAKKLTNRSI